METAVNSLSEQSKKIEIAAFYTHNDMDKAKQMMAGTYKDVYAIKANFKSTTIYGAFIAFFNHIFLSANNVYAILTHEFEIQELKTNIDWRSFEVSLQEIVNTNNHDEVLTSHFKDALMSGFSLQFCVDLKKLINAKDEISVNRLFQKYIQGRLSFANVVISVDCEALSSLDMEISSLTSKKIDSYELQKKRDEETKKQAPLKEEDDVLYGKDIKLIFMASLVLSPIKGKEISQIVAGDRVKLSIIDSNSKVVQLARAFNAVKEDGSFKPISGRVLSIKHREEGGYKIIAIVAKGIYAKIEEDEENIKVGVDTPDAAGNDSDSSSISIFVVITLIIIFIGLVATILVLIL